MLAQIVYYFYAWGRVRRETGCRDVYFSVPTGNFGDIFAGYLAKRMGLPIRRLILATNENNILSRFVREGDYSIDEVVANPLPVHGYPGGQQLRTLSLLPFRRR